MAVTKPAQWLPALVVGAASLLALFLNFDSILLHPGAFLPGTPNERAYSLLHVWWPVTSVPQPDDLTIHSFIGAPYLTNHLRYTPVLQSILFYILKIAGPVLAFNLLMLASQLASQLVLFWFFVRKGIPWLWAALAATAFVLSPWYTGVIAQANLITAGWWLPPLALIVWDQWTEQPSNGRAAIIVAVLYGAVLCGVQNILWTIALWLPYAVWTGRAVWIATPTDHPKRTAFRDQASAMILTFLVLFLFYPTPGMVRALQGNEPAYGPPLSEPILRSFIGWILRTSPAIFIAAFVTSLSARSIRAVLLWLIVAVISLLMGFGILPDPLNIFTGALGLPYWPLADRSYFFGIGLFAMLVYIAMMWREHWQSGLTTKWGLAGLASLVLVVGTNTDALRAVPSHEVNIPAFYIEIASEPEDYILLEYPVGLVSVGDERTLGDAAYLARNAVWSLKRPVSGLAPYYTSHVFDQVQATTFLFPGTLTSQTTRSAANALGQAVREWRIGYIVVHPDLVSTELQSIIQTLIEQSDSLCPPVERDGLIVYRALWHPFGCMAPQ